MSIADEPRPDTPELRDLDERALARLDDDQRKIAHALRAAARVVAAAGLPCEYRRAAFEHVAELELEHALERAA